MLSYNSNDIVKAELIKYVQETVGFEMEIRPLNSMIKGKLPVYLRDEYVWYEAKIDAKACLLAFVNHGTKVSQLLLKFQIVKEITSLPVVAVIDSLEAIIRKRLIEKKIAFIVPGKQIYIPEFIIDLKEYTTKRPKEKKTLTPLAQQLLLLFILDKENRLAIEHLIFKKLAELLETNQMAVTRAVENLKNLNLLEIQGSKEKRIHFVDEKLKLWNNAKDEDLLINPVMNKIYVDELPETKALLKTNDNALTNYTDINPVKQKYYAMDKNLYYHLKKANDLINENDYEGKYGLEIWKYNPNTINKLLFPNIKYVDPLSLLLTYQDIQDERIELALEQIEELFIPKAI